ncbi:hypothetical protein FIBSPDRAFT_822718 [Athelia psychrophila]|uniref:Uncharacterized protein n=1 Tax=Athelia psychrophila TaxID=1759441 RepID=A0A166MG08_9AGAM|nr:hypothetical protein FIBSPDRAFT_822718 [Fibularhizoctonia sp. CBS 109695]
MFSKGTTITLYIAFVHLVGLYLFTSGFLLTRLSLPQKTTCNPQDPTSCTVPATHSRLVFLIIDALRFDFISPSPPSPASPHHHNVLTLPHMLSAKFPDRSFIFDAHADPPTTTLQRIKGLTTGSLPTFIDMGSNFAGSSVVEDSIITQMESAGKKIAFMGDETWMSVFPSSFSSNMTFPYDSFNVEDLHTVDTGVITHLFPLLSAPKPQPWDVLIGHFLGVDHVGHRVGPDHPIMHAKLTQMDEVLAQVVDALDDDTLLVLIGDHGMDASGDHGGDSPLEVSSGVWVYSKGKPLFTKGAIPKIILSETVFPRATESHRAIQQIDLVPTLSLLMGLPIPFNNLGSIVPELFARDKKDAFLMHALELNAQQVHTYLDTYRASASGSELDGAWDDLQVAWAESAQAQGSARLLSLNAYVRLALKSCRLLWAQFNVVLMNMGLVLLAAGVLAGWALYSRLGEDWEVWLGEEVLPMCVRGMAGGAATGLVGYLALQNYLQGIDAMHCVLFGGSLMSCLILLFHTARPRLSLAHFSPASIPLSLIIHTAAFLSNSFTVWEDRIIQFLLLSSIVPSVLVGLQAPTARLRYRILGFSALFAVCTRLMALSTACREEQQSYCHVTFYASSSSSPPLIALVLGLPTAMALPYAIWRFLAISGSDEGVAKPYLGYFFAPSLVAGTAFWVLEWAEVTGTLGGGIRLWRTCIAWLAFAVTCISFALWWAIPLCLRLVTDDGVGKAKREVKILGFANAYGAPFLIFWCIPFGVVYLSTQLAGQLVLALGAVALLAHVEVRDSVRDVKGMEIAFSSASNPTEAINMDVGSMPVILTPVTLADIAPFALLGLHAFFGTGHQASIPSIQWKTAFLFTSTVTYPFSPITVILNTLGPQFIFATAVPLVAAWNVPPLPAPVTGHFARGQSLRAGLGVMTWGATLLLGAAGGAALLRRHLMVWKIFAPRFMLGGVGLLAVDAGVLVGLLAFERVRARVDSLFGGAVGGKSNGK